MLLPLVAAGTAFVAYQWTQERDAAFARMLDNARTVQRAVDREFALDLAVLRALAASSEIDRRDWRAFHALAAASAQARPGSWFALYEPGGQNIVNTRFAYGTPLPNLRQLRTSRADADWEGRKIPLLDLGCLFGPLETGKPCFSGLVYGVVTKRPAVGMIVPVLRDGEPVYVLALVYSSQFFEHLLQEESAVGATTAMLDERGLFIARNRDSERFVGLPAPGPFREGTTRLPPQGVGETLNVESIPHVYAYSRSGLAGVVIAAGMPRSAVLAPAWRALWLWLGILGSAGLLGSVFAFRLWRSVGTPLVALARHARVRADPGGTIPDTTIEEVEALRSALQDAAQSEQARRESEERYRTLFTNMTEGFALGEAIVDEDGGPCDVRFLEMNEAFERQTGLDREATRGRPLREVLPHIEQSWIDTYCAVALGAPPRRFESYNRDLDRHFDVYCFSPARGRFAIIFSDVTDRKRAEDAAHRANEQLREADRRKDQWLAQLSHELRNPLAPIRNSLYLLDRADPNGQQARRAKEVANRQVGHLTRLVDDLLDVTRIARGKIELRRADIDVAALARRTAEDHRALMEDRDLHLGVDVPDQPVVVHGDETRLAQVLGNLLHNAAKFTPGGGRVTLAVGVEDGRAAIHVHDTGPGIEPEVLPTIFEPFTQAKQTLARTEGGLGLGLALVKGLVGLHGGEVVVNSTKGTGTEFVVTLPLAVQRARTGADDDGPHAMARGPRRRVLVIDDNKDAAESLAQLVEMFGHEVHVAFDAVTGLEMASKDLPDIVLCDIGLPGMDGYEFARQLRAMSSKRAVRLVAVSGYAQSDDVQKATDAGFDAHVAKPPDPAQIERLLGP